MRQRLGLKGYGSEKFYPEGYSVAIRQEGKFSYVTIIAPAQLSYDFFTSDHVLLENGALGSPGHTLSPAYVCGSLTRLSAKHGRPVFSSTLTPDALDPRWTLRDCTATPRGAGYKVFGAWQNQKFFEYVWWPNNGDKSMVVSTQAQAPGWNSQCGWLGASRWAPNFETSNGLFTADVGLDVPPGFFSAGGGYQIRPDFTSTYVWWRRAAVQGKFVICTDNVGRFHVFRKTKGEDEHISAFRTYTPPYPGWVTVPDPSDPRNYYGEWLWNFNKDATKCVTCPFNSVNGPFYKNISQPFGAILPENVATFANPVLAREDTPGLVELGITITETGTGLLDFEVAFEVLRTCYSGSDNRWIVDAAYSLPDVESIGVPEGTLVTAELECFVPAGGYTVGPVAAPGYPAVETEQAFHALKSYLVINTNDLDFVPTEKQRIQLQSPINGRFLTIDGYRNQVGTPYTATSYLVPAAGGGTAPAYATDPVLYSATVPEPSGLGSRIGVIWALELRTLSVLYSVRDEISGRFVLTGLAYNTQFHQRDLPIGYTKTEPYGPYGTPSERVPTTARLIYQYAWALSFKSEWGAGFSIHPAGHWALSVTYELQFSRFNDDFDWISVKNKDGTRTKYRHLDLYNEAFGQTRDYLYYSDYVPAFSTQGLYDYGNVRTNGVFCTF